MSSTTLPAGYALDPGWHAERDRLDSLTSLYDARTLQLCERLGLSAGWHCLDAGAGTGSLAVALAERVGPTGTITALDSDTRILAPLESERLVVVEADLAGGSLHARQFDLVHARLVLEHLPERERVLADLASAVRPGGWLLIEDFDWSTATVIDPPSDLHERVTRACLTLFTAHAYDANFGRRLPRLLVAAGLVEGGTHAEAVQVRADRELGLPQWELLVDQLAPALLAHGLIDEAELERFHALCHDGETVCFAPLMVSAWGRKPEAMA
jgi:2-polyprenyl-3-methyl-5-hydroxy-6-metoxy-1,4-benzoquinol methylase